MRNLTKFTAYLVLGYIALMPLGQLPGWFIQLYFGLPIRIHPADALALLIATMGIYGYGMNLVPKPFFKIIALFGFSFLLSLPLFFEDMFPAFLYLLRLFGYIGFGLTVYRLLIDNYLRVDVLKNSLIAVSFFVAVFGFIQLISLPDLTALKHFGWDDHLYRLVSTYLDPAFTGIILTLGTLYAAKNRSRVSTVVFVIMTIALAFTYSRASYLSFVAAHGYSFFKSKTLISLLGIILLLFSISLLPKPSGEGVNLLRTNSIQQKSTNTTEALDLISKYPVFGVGFNNVCSAKQVEGLTEWSDHSCSGFDNSYLFLVATVGLVGTLLVFGSVMQLTDHLAELSNKSLLYTSIIALGIHSLFTNTLFYPFLMGSIGIILSVCVMENRRH